MAEDRDVVIVGAGIAGLVAAQRLQDRAPLVLEAGDRVGGRMWSQRRGDLALSVGAHMFPPPDSVIGRLVAEHGLEVMPITGSMLNIHYGGRLVRDTRPELMPFRLPMSLRGRISFARAGLKVKRDGDRYMKLIQHRPGDTEAAIRLRGLQHGGDQTFAEFLGPLHPAGRRDLPRARQPLDRRARGDLAGRHGGAVRPRVGQRRPRTQHARRLRAAAGRPRPGAGRHHPPALRRRVRALGRCGRARALRRRGRQRRGARPHGDRRRPGPARAGAARATSRPTSRRPSR